MIRVAAPITPRLPYTTSRLLTTKYSSYIDVSPLVNPQTHLIMASIYIPEFPRCQPPSAYLYYPDHSLQVNLRIHLISASKCIYILPCSWPSSTSLRSHYHHEVKQRILTARIRASIPFHTSHDIEREIMRKKCSGSSSLGRGWENMLIYPVVSNRTNCIGRSKISESVRDQELGKIECVFCKMGKCLSTLGSPKQIPPVPQTLSIIPVLLDAPCRLLPVKRNRGGAVEWIFLPQWPPRAFLSPPNRHL